MKIHPMSKIVTSFPLIYDFRDFIPTPCKDDPQCRGCGQYPVKPGFELVAASLVRTAAHTIYISNIQPDTFPNIEETIAQYPPSLQDRIQVIDKDRTLFHKVLRYLKPVYDDVEASGVINYLIEYGFVLDFLYKLAIACKLEAEADISLMNSIGRRMEFLKETVVKDDEARFRLDQLYGIYHIYESPIKIDALTILPKPTEPSIYQRVSDLLETAEMIELSKNRYLLGIPSKVKIAVKKMRRCVTKLVSNRKYSRKIEAATDVIQTASSIVGISFPSGKIYDLLKNISISSYRPPIVDLDYFRFSVAKAFSPTDYNCVTYILPIGGFWTEIKVYKNRQTAGVFHKVRGKNTWHGSIIR